MARNFLTRLRRALSDSLTALRDGLSESTAEPSRSEYRTEVPQTPQEKRRAIEQGRRDAGRNDPTGDRTKAYDKIIKWFPRKNDKDHSQKASPKRVGERLGRIHDLSVDDILKMTRDEYRDAARRDAFAKITDSPYYYH